MKRGSGRKLGKEDKKGWEGGRRGKKGEGKEDS